MSATVRTIDTPSGMARAHIERPRPAASPRGVVVLSHGAGGGIEAPDLDALRRIVDDGWTYVRVEQPWRVAGKRVAPRPATLDQAWGPIVRSLRSGRGALRGPLVVGGRSAGARVAARTAGEVGADAVLALSFPLHPPGKPDKSRAAEFQAVLDAGLGQLIVQGRADPFGGPGEVRDAIPGARVREVAGTHSIGRTARDAEQIVAIVREWLDGIGGGSQGH